MVMPLSGDWRDFGPQAAQFAKLGDAVAQLHASPTGGTVRQVPEGFAFTPLPPQPTPRLDNNAGGVLMLPNADGQLHPVAAPLLASDTNGKPVVEPGIQSLRDGRADWCQGCGQCRYRHDMRWLVDAYRCRVCLGPGVGVSALWVSPWHEQPEPEVVAWPWASWRQAGYVALTAALALLFLASALGAFG
ncbi:hypothetical protein FDI63_gp074 [Mycobacterium phage ChrisnMich]|uniref:Uncharacterized protein n=1 Tax=Mycobacterium phage ChrisnMich TaxID=1034130 RepID=G1BLD1_9CAUD|nr:hypothetical protein FDI63_gp074 [Mycobacterium phage ChrisnMich]AEJ94619.1 hypothetical protein CHRISNMICH_74 [Mycobacterium phage ChrisnMich]